MSKLFPVFTFALLFSFSLSKAQVNDKRFAGLDTTFARVLKDWKAAGFAVAVIEKNKIVYTKGFGYRDYEKKLPVTPNTLFAIGSCTKAFTSSLLGLLQKDGKLDFDKPVRDYLPDLKFYNDAMNSMVTVRDMMCHRTGLPRHDLSWYFFPTTRDSFLYRIRFQEPTAGIREIYQYNNFMFLAQGVLAEKLSGRKWEQLIKQRIFDSLGMVQSNFSVKDMEKSSDAALGYTVEKDSIMEKIDYFNIDAMGPAGSINSSVTEMANWVITWIHGGKFNGKQVLPASYTSQAISSQMVSSAGVPDKENPDVHMSAYGFAWSLSSYRGHYRVQHGGNIDGFSAITCFYPSDSIGIVVLANQNASAVPGIVRNILSDRMLNLSRKDWNTSSKKIADKAKADAKQAEAAKSSTAKKNTKPGYDWKSYEGLYTHAGYGSFDVSAANDSLFAYTPNFKIWLRPYYYDIFEGFDVDKKTGIDTTNKNFPRIHFEMNTQGEIESLSCELQAGIKPLVFKRSPKAKPLTKEDLQKYVGEYELPGMTVKVEIRNENVLFVVVPGQPDYETIPVGNHEFKLKILSGYSIKFELNEKAESVAASFIQPNGTFRAKRK